MMAFSGGIMNIEIERKFLVDQKHERLIKDLASEVILISQSYMSINPEYNTRVRRSIYENNTVTITHTTKGKSVGARRVEIEYDIRDEDYKSFLGMSVGYISKSRYLVHIDDKLWEIDMFHHSKMGKFILAEIELNDENEENSIPFWVGKEVTCDHNYSNSNLIIKNNDV